MKRSREAKISGGKNVQRNLGQEREVETHRALLNDVVLENIFKYLGYKDLKSCRDVGNITWLRNSKKAWWSQTKIVLKTSLQIERGSYRLVRREERITDLLNQTEINSNATNYTIDQFDDTCEHVLRFLDQLGPSIKYLELKICYYHSVDSFRKLLYTQCPNLQKLVVGTFSIKILQKHDIEEPLKWGKPQFGEQGNLKVLKVDGSNLPVSFMELLSHFPNLKDLGTNAKNDGIFKAISMIRQHDPKMLKLTHIHISIESESDLVEKLVTSVYLDHNLSLEALNINTGYCQPATIVDILDLHAKSLKHLSIHEYTCSLPNPQLNLPRQPLQILEEMRIEGCSFSAEIFKYTPNVKKFVLYNNDITFPASMTKRNLSVNTCKELKLMINPYAFRPFSDFKSIIALFPNVEIFETGKVNNLRFRIICEHLTKLVTLSISYDCEVDVVGLLGFDPDSEAEDEIRGANITNLKDLQSFSADSRVRGVSRKITGMRNGNVLRQELEKLRHLKKFQLEKYQLIGDEQSWNTIFEKYSGK